MSQALQRLAATLPRRSPRCGLGARPAVAVCALAFVLAAACERGSPPSPSVRLLERFDAGRVESPSAPGEAPPRRELRFDGTGLRSVPTGGPSLSDLRVVEGRLAGRTTGPGGVLLLALEEPLGEGDRLHAVEVRARVSAGAQLSLSLRETAEVDLEAASRAAARGPGAFHTPLVPGDEARLYTMTVATSFAMGETLTGIQGIVIHPSDVAGAEFALDSVRLVFRKEYLAGVPSGPSWQGLGEVWRETLVTRSPEVLRFPLELGQRPWLDLAVGTLEDGPVTFRVSLETGEGTTELLRRTVSTPDRWEELAVDLGREAGRSVTLALAAEAPEGGRIGFWGTPVVRHRGTPPPRAGTGPWPRGVLLIIADTLRRDHLSVYGHARPNAPVLERLAEEGVVFEDGIAQGTWTKVSVTSILSSLHPSSHGVADTDDRLSAAATTLAEAFRAAGYATWASSSVPFTGQLTNLHQGVEVLHERASVELPEGVSRSKTARVFADRLLRWLEPRHESPFFATLHVFDPHSPFAPYPPYDELWADAEWRAEFERQVARVKEVIEDPFLRGQVMPSRRELERAGVDPEPYVAYERAWYDGSIRAMDVEIGRILEALENLGLAEDTLVAFVADHGEEFLEHGRHWHGQSVYGEMTNVPLLLWWPRGLPGGRRVAETVATIDLAPTLLELAGLSLPESYQGESLVPLARPEGARRWRPRPVLSEVWLSPEEAPHRRDEVDSFSLVLDGWRLVHNTVRAAERPEYELYDHRTDPLNLRDVAADHPEVVERLAAELARLRGWAESRRLSAEAEGEGLSAAELEQLRSLGYLQ